MKNITLLFILITSTLFGQIQTSWQTLSEAPFGSRKNDAIFLNENLGWIVSGSGEAHRTTDGGETWQLMFSSNNTFFRSVAFVDPFIGFIGNLGPDEYGGPTITDETLIYRTTDAGFTWQPIENINGETGKGICGMMALPSGEVYAVGRVRGPSFFMKSTDAGKTWSSSNLAFHAMGLIDVHFFNPDTGIIVALTNSEHLLSRGNILKTVNGGETWEEVYVSEREGEWCWKISFPSKQTGYVSLQRNIGFPVNLIKTTDGGNTWFEKQVFDRAYFVQGIGFANDTLGWIGGNSTQTTYQTTDGGDSWFPANFGSRINRFRFIDELTGYAAGQTIYKYTGSKPTSITNETKPEGFNLTQNYPNPFNPATTIKFTIPNLKPADGGSVNGLLYTTIKIYDSLGKLVATIVDEELRPGENEVQFYSGDLSSGVYYYQFQAGDYVESKKMMILK
jgi:photosystem II stability/assembly factor-like uncharacterized protein